MKRIITVLCVLLLALLTACAAKGPTEEKAVEVVTEKKAENVETPKGESKDGLASKGKIKLGTVSFCLDLVEAIKQDFEDRSGYELEIVVFDDYIQPNVATVEGSIDVNVFQYEPYLDEYNKDMGTNLKAYKKTFGIVEALYSSKIKSLDELQDGAKVGVISSPSNKAVALRILEEQGLLTLKEDVALPNVLDILENPKNLEIVELGDGRALVSSIEDFDIIQTSGINMQMADYDPMDALAFASDKIHYELGFCIVTKEERQNEEWLEDLAVSLNSDVMEKFIEENYQGSWTLTSN